MFKKNKKLILLVLSSTLAVGAGMSVLLTSSFTNNTSISKVASEQQVDASNIDVPTENNDQNANLSTNSGPVTFLGNTITALDWFGEKIWSLDMTKYVPDQYNNLPGTTYTGSWSRAWNNWDYNRTTNQIWILGYFSVQTKQQPIICVDAATGAIVSQTSIDYTTVLPTVTEEISSMRFISALNSGKVMVYGGAGTSYDGKAILYDPSTKDITLVSGNSNSILPLNDTTFGTNYKWYFFNLIPVANNKNLVELVTFSNVSTKDDTVAGTNASYDIYFLLVDDNLNMVYTTGTWATYVKVANHLEGYRNTQVTPQRDYYTMLNGKVVTVVYNTVIVIDATNSSDITYASFPMTDVKWIQSWSFDANENLYFKFKDSGIIYKVSGDTWKTITNGISNNVSPTTYLDLSSITSDNVQTYANNFIIYNVYGFTGQLMLLNSIYNVSINTTNQDLLTNGNPDNYGLAIAVTQNATNQSQGDYKGALNGPNSIQKSADFALSVNAIATKIPSEITSSDIEFLNGGFLKTGDKTGFVINSLDDTTGAISITCNLYQIPWFSATLPDTATPKTITHTYTTSNKIANKISWKTLSTTSDYDFLNMLPSKVQVSDIQNTDPFQVSFQSQTITDASGNQLYPKKTYTIGTTDDITGSIVINVSYQYVPMSTNYTGADTDVKTYTASHTYTIFKSTDTASFMFAGQANSSQTTVDIANVPELSSLRESNVLPSSFNNLGEGDASNSSFLQFVNTTTSKGYPISKMDFTVAADDSAGTLKITGTMPAAYSPQSKDETFSVTYTGLNENKEYSFSFNGGVTTIEGTEISQLLPSSVTSGNVINELITYTGFNSNDFTISLTPNDVDGTLEVAVTLNSSYASAIGGSDHGFSNYVATYTFNGFMTTDQYNSRYSVTFVDDSSETLIDLKQKQASEIFDALVGTTSIPATNKLEIGDKTYTSLKELIEDLLVSKKGSLIPSDWKDNPNIIATMYVDNSLGTASFYVTIPQSQMEGADSDLNLAVTYTGFVIGNAVSTNDNLSFIPSNMLENYLVSSGVVDKDTFENFTATSFANWLTANDNKYALQLISYKTGQYVTDLSNPTTYELFVIPNDEQKIVTITIHFNNITDDQSLSEYSIQYVI